jgi:hypothetical protein
MADGRKRKRQGSWRCSPKSPTTTTNYWATFGSADTTYATTGAEPT